MGAKIGVAANAVCATGPHVYQTVGSPITDAPEEKTRCGGRSIDMGIPTTLDAYEATALISYAQGDTCHCGPEFDIKMFGPGHHADTDCCWWLFCINADGQGSVTTGGEGPHPKTDKKSTQDVIPGNETVGSVEGKTIGIKGVTWLNTDASRHVEGWVDTTGSGTSWCKVVEDNISRWGKETTATAVNDEETLEAGKRKRGI